MVTIEVDWIQRLSRDGEQRDAALGELGSLLRRRLAAALRGRDGVDDPFLDDCTQEAIIKVLDALPSFAGRSQFTTWATTIAVRTALSELRRRHWRDVSIDQLQANDDSPVSPIVGPAASAIAHDLTDRLHQLIEERLTDKQRRALTAELEGMPLEEIARRTGGTRNAIYKLTHDARKRLRAGLEAAGFTAADLATLSAQGG